MLFFLFACVFLMSLFKFVFSFCVYVCVCELWFLFNGLRLFVIRDSFIASNMFHVLYFWLFLWHNKTQKQKQKETEGKTERERGCQKLAFAIRNHLMTATVNSCEFSISVFRSDLSPALASALSVFSNECDAVM